MVTEDYLELSKSIYTLFKRNPYANILHFHLFDFLNKIIQSRNSELISLFFLENEGFQGILKELES